jgi:transposase
MEVSLPNTRKYRHHPVAFKRQIVELSLLPNASVAKLAQEHEINANQIFAWRKAYRNGTLETTGSMTLVPVEVVTPTDDSIDPASEVPHGHGRLEVVVGAACLRVIGTVDTAMLRTAIAALITQ